MASLKAMANSMYFIIPGRLPGLNEVNDSNRTHVQIGARLKRDVQNRVMWSIRKYMASGDVRPVDYPVDVTIHWYEPNRRRDVDNIQSGTKFILDAMVKLKLIPNDGQRWVRQIYHKVFKDDDGDGYVLVMVRPAPAEDEQALQIKSKE